MCATLATGDMEGGSPRFKLPIVSKQARQGLSPLSKAAYCAIRKKNNRSGISGLTRVDTWEMYKGRRFRRLYWEAQWPIGNGKGQHKKFSITKYGEDGAYLRAFTARATALKALSTQTFSPYETRIRRRGQAD